MAEPEYDVALSFAGEDRTHAEELASLLRSRSVTVFYDEYELGRLWGKDLYEHLARVYSEDSRFCVMFLSEHYARKLWTNHERKSAQARAFQESREYILPIRLDDTEIPGIPGTIGYVDLRQQSIEEVAEMVVGKLGRSQDVAPVTSEARDRTRSIVMPGRRQTFTDRDRNRYLREALTHIRDYFREGLRQLEAEAGATEGELEEIDSRTFLALAYVHGTEKARARIWIGGLAGGDNSICYREGHDLGAQGNSMNDWLSVDTDGPELYLRPSGMGLMVRNDKERLTQEEGAAYYWQRFISRLEER